MSILNYLSVSSSSTPITPDSIPSQPQSQPPLPTKVLLPKKKPQKWSTGMAPGDYGGPPPTTKLRKYWGGEKDALANDDFMWNKDFMDQMKRYIQEPDASLQSPPVKEKPSGFLSFNRVMGLDSMDYGKGFEQQKWDRATKAATGGNTCVLPYNTILALHNQTCKDTLVIYLYTKTK
ncbi:hypothetical protein MKW94_003744, partial [Papaver nudicaule]|nr:hypothetical protein [Papaver nudicaule]